MDVIVALGLPLAEIIRFELNTWMGLYVSTYKY